MATFSETLTRRRRARMRFKAFIRLVMANRFWLQEIEEANIGMNITKNLAIITRRTARKGIITIAEKALINKPRNRRTLEEKRKLAILFSSLECFAQFSPKVRARIAPYLKYLYYNTGRIIAREGDPPLGIYFIVEGEIVVTKRVWDFVIIILLLITIYSIYSQTLEAVEKVTKKYEQITIAVLGAGDVFGEFALILESVRPVTTTSASDVELLVLYDVNFKPILKPEMKLLWRQKLAVMHRIPYFNSWDRAQLYLGCKLAKVKQFNPLETIYSKDGGMLDNVYFVVSGQCMILQLLKLHVKVINGKKVYTLCEEVEEEKEDTGMSLYQMYQEEKEARKSVKLEREIKEKLEQEALGDLVEQNSDEKTKLLNEEKEVMAISRFKKDWTKVNYCGVKFTETRTISDESIVSKRRATIVSLNKSALLDFENDQSEDTVESIQKTSESDHVESRTSTEIVIEKSDITTVSELTAKDSYHPTETDVDTFDKKSIMKSFLYKNTAKENVEVRHTPVRFAEYQSPPPEKEPDLDNIENHFVSAGYMTAGSIFGLGETMFHRAIMAQTTVQCLLIPRYWLLEKSQNPGNLWQQIKFHLGVNIPSRQQLLDDFIATQKWNKFKKQTIEMSLDKTRNRATKIDDIPIFCRIMEGPD